MRQSQLFTKIRKEAPKDEIAKNASLLIRAGFIHKEMAGVYSYLPLGLKVLTNINQIIRKEMNALGGEEILLTNLQNPDYWRTSGRWAEAAVWFKTNLNDGATLGLGWTHEEAVTNLMRNQIQSYRDLPRAVYQIQNKFRNEERAKSGILRGREFMMKDLYSFHADQTDLDHFYELVTAAYRQIFKRVGIGDQTYLTFAAGGAFSKFSHEFQTISATGEDTIYLAPDKNLAVNKEVLTPAVLAELGLKEEELVAKQSIEVGNIFKLGSRFSEPLDLSFIDEAGSRRLVIMGCYGIGPSRLLGTVAEILSDEAGLVWPPAIAPFAVHLVRLGTAANQTIVAAADRTYDELIRHGVSVLYDDREVSAGEKFAGADLLGLPDRVVVSDKTLAANIYEIKDRSTGTIKSITIPQLVDYFTTRHV